MRCVDPRCWLYSFVRRAQNDFPYKGFMGIPSSLPSLFLRLTVTVSASVFVTVSFYVAADSCNPSTQVSSLIISYTQFQRV
jgi:hypothetical protein